LSSYTNPVLLKEGGQKVVYRVTHPDYGEVALKIGQYSTQQSLERIKREVAVLKDIDSQYYPKNYDFQVVSADRFFIIEEYIDSKPLSAHIKDYDNPKEAIELIIHLITGLKIIWDKRVIHRDLKPDNILIIKNAPPKIIDLGIARLLDMDSITRTLAMRGPCTPIYAAPEQLSNRKTEITIRTDLFNLGLILFQLLLQGEHPFDPMIVGSGATTVENILRNNWAKTRLNTPELIPIRPVIIRLLGHEPYQRYRNSELLLADLHTALETYK
jgi:serine/threonine-protein kinase